MARTSRLDFEDARLNWYWYDLGYACGALIVLEDEIVGSCPIYRKMIGRKLSSVRRGTLKKLPNAT